MSKPAIPSVHSGNALHDQAHSAMKATLDAITGQARNVERLPPLPATATLGDVIARLNALTERMQ